MAVPFVIWDNPLVSDYDPAYAPKKDPALEDRVAEAERAGSWKAYEAAKSMAELPSKEGRYEDPMADLSENELQAGTGQVCPVCHRLIEAGELRRRRIDGTYQHDAC